jgi:ribonuclease HI
MVYMGQKQIGTADCKTSGKAVPLQHMAAKSKKKYYVVWAGAETGIFDSWAECQLAIKGYPNAQYKSFKTREAAEQAWAEGPDAHINSAAKSGKPQPASPPDLEGVIWDSISVDAACSGNPGAMEYQGVHTRDKTQLFHQQFALGTNNIGEFLAIVHALALLQQQGLNKPIYTDSRIAMGWVQRKKCKTTLPRNARTQRLYQLIDRAETWLRTNTYSTPILKWDTKRWGEIPADFGRK